MHLSNLFNLLLIIRENYNKKKNDEQFSLDLLYGLVFQLITMIGFICWGIHEIWFVSCVDKGMLIYTLSEVTICYFITFYICVILYIVYTCFNVKIKLKNNKKTPHTTDI